jgi:acetyl esterase/lipase
LQCVSREPDVPPLGVSMSEVESASDASAEPKDAGAGAITIARVSDCELPAFLANDAAGPSVIEDVAYGDDKRQSYDLVLPAGAPKALVVIVHGGGWTSGGKGLYRPTIRALGALGYAAASVGYRLASDASRAFPVGLADVRCAIRAAQAKAGLHKTILLGASAGGHLAAMVATEPDAPVFDGDCADRKPVRVSGVVLYYAPLELDRSRERYVPIMRQAVDEFLYGAQTWAEAGVDAADAFERDRSDWSIRAVEATPSHHTLRNAAPMLILQGAADTIVPPADARDFAAALARAGVPHLVVELPDQKHGFPVLGHKPELKPASCSMLHFLEQIAEL